MDKGKQDEIMEMKGMVLEHVLYEMQMYLYSLLVLNCKFPKDQLMQNMTMVSHETHLRNLLEFFTDARHASNIIYPDILDTENNKKIVTELTIDDKVFYLDWTVKKVINKSISHLTKERVTLDVTQPTIGVIKNMGKVVPFKIKMFIEYLATDLKENWEIKEKLVITLAEERDSEHIQKIIESIKDMLNEIDIY